MISNQVKNIAAGMAVMFSPRFLTLGSFDNTNDPRRGLSSNSANPVRWRESEFPALTVIFTSMA